MTFGDRVLSLLPGLSTETELLDDFTVPFNVNLLEIVEELTALAYETEQRTACHHVFLVLLHMLGKVSDTVREQSDLALGGTSIVARFSVLCENFLLFRRL